MVLISKTSKNGAKTTVTEINKDRPQDYSIVLGTSCNGVPGGYCESNEIKTPTIADTKENFIGGSLG